MFTVFSPPMTDANVHLQAQTAASASLQANLVCRVLFAILGSLLCWVPFRLLVRNGEFAAVVFIVSVVVTNLFTVVNSLLWRNDYWDLWYDGHGWCDLQVWLVAPLQTIYATSIFAIMRHLAEQVGLMRVATLSPREKRRRNLIQALIIFPVPLIQLTFTWFDLAQRYIIGTLIGCSATYDNSWPKIFVYSVPPMLFALGSMPYAFLTWKRYRAIANASAAALISNSSAASRANRTRRRLYQMSLSILVPYVPVMIAFFVYSILDTGDFKPYNYHRIHYTPEPYPWNSVVLVPSWMVPFPAMNQPWVPILTTIPIVLFFGMTQDAVDTYRRYTLAVGLGKCWPALHKDHTKNKQRNTGSSNDRSFQRSTKTRSPETVPRRSQRPSLDTAPRFFVLLARQPPRIPPRGSSKNRTANFRRMLEQTAPIREKLASIGSSRGGSNKGSSSKSGSSKDRSNNFGLEPLRHPFQPHPIENRGERKRRRRARTHTPLTSSSESDTSVMLIRKSSLRPPPYNLVIPKNNEGNNNNDNNFSKSASQEASPDTKDKGKGKGKATEPASGGNPSTSDIGVGVDDANDDASTAMSPMRIVRGGNKYTLKPIEPVPAPKLHVPDSEPRSEDGAPVTLR
ncbi:pheromone A receptor-domain-containing protein [Apiospora arundinis]